MGKYLNIVIVILIVCILGVGGYLLYDKVLKKNNDVVPINTPSYNNEEVNPVVNKSNSFNYNLILNNHALAEKNKNYLISPYSIEIALNMLRDGASGETKSEIDKVIGTRKINDVTIKDKVSVANSIFIRDIYEGNVLTTYKDKLKNNYNADMIIDKFATPDKINEWVHDKTNGMIDKILNSVSPDFVLGLANALSMDIEWENVFECSETKSQEFTKIDGSKINVEMMHKDGNQYIKEDNVEGIILPYKKEEGSNTELEFIGLIPTGDLTEYLNKSFEKDMGNLNNIIKTPIKNDNKEQIVKISLPRFTYDSEIKKDSDNKLFIHLLQDMGIKKAFLLGSSEFDNMVVNIPKGVYVSEAVHKTHIELMENGTKASAVTSFGLTNSSSPLVEKEYIEITFNKPFIYIIRERNTNEMLFFGVVYEPNIWKGTTCNNTN